MKTGRKNIVIVCAAGAFLLIAAVLAGMYLYLPVFVQNRLLPQLAQNLGLTPEDIRVRRIGLTTAELGPIRFSAEGRPALSADTIRLRYRLRALLHGRIEEIILTGLSVDVLFEEHGVRVAGIRRRPGSPQARLDTAQPKLNWPRRLESVPPVSIGHISLQQAHITLTRGDQVLAVPLSAAITTSALEQGRLEGNFHLWPLQSRIEIKAHVDTRRNTARLDLLQMHAALEKIAPFLPTLPGLRMAAAVNAQGRAQCRLQPFELTRLDVSALFDDMLIGRNAFQIQNATSAGGGAAPARLAIRLQDNRLNWSLEPLQLASPLKTRISSLAGWLAAADDGFELNLSGRGLIPVQTVAWGTQNPVELAAPLPVQLDLLAQRNTGQAVDFKASVGISDEMPGQPPTTLAGGLPAGLPGNTQSPPLALKSGNMLAAADLPRIELSGTYQGGRAAHVKTHLRAPQIRLDWLNGRASGNDLELAAEVFVTLAGGGKPQISGTARAQLARISARNASLQASSALLKADARLNQKDGAPLTVHATVHLHEAAAAAAAGADAGESRRAWAADGISLQLPLRWPISADSKIDAPPGKLTIAAVHYNGSQLGGVEGTVRQQATGLSIAAHHASQLFRGMNVSIHSSLEAGGGTLDIHIPAYRIPTEIDLGQFAQKAAGYQLKGQVEANAHVSFKKGPVARSHAAVRVRDATVRHENSGLNLEGIAAAIRFEDLFGLQTASGQTLNVANMQLGAIKTSDLAVMFQVKGPNEVLIEKAHMTWCQGAIRTNAIVLSAGNDFISATLIGKDLNPVMILEQLGVAQGKGRGTVSGQIPLSMHHGRLRFNNGRLASPPGQSGTLQIERLGGSEYLQSGLPEGTPQRAQLDIATEALKDYTYEHIELRLQSEKEKVLLGLRVNGKPNRLLPFEYDTQAGKFMHTQGQGRAEFKGIDIDLNFRSPLDEILRYRQLLKGK